MQHFIQNGVKLSAGTDSTSGDPLQDMKVMKRVAVIIKDGVRYK